MQGYDDLLTLSDLLQHEAFLKLKRCFSRLKDGPLEKSSFTVAADAINDLQKIVGRVGSAAGQSLDPLGRKPKNVADWGLKGTIFFFVKDVRQDPNDNRQWIRLVNVQFIAGQKLGVLMVRPFPLRMQYAHIRRRLLERSGHLLDLNSDPIIFLARTSAYLSTLLPLVEEAPQQDGIYPVFLPQPQGLLLGCAKPAETEDFGYAYGQLIEWEEKPAIETPPAKGMVLPGLPGGHLPSTPPRPFLQKAARRECVVTKIQPTVTPRLELVLNTYYDLRMMPGGLRGLYNHHLVQLLDDKRFSTCCAALTSFYNLGDAALIDNRHARIFKALEYGNDLLKGIITHPRWQDAAPHSLKSYFEANGPN